MTQVVTKLDNLAYALNYAADWSWSVFPLHSIASDGFCTCGNQQCKSEGKHPRTKHGLKDATRDADQIKEWWSKWPDANIGIATGKISGLAVIDIDTAKGANSMDLIIGSLGHSIFSTIKVKTGGGMHYYYKYPASGVSNSASKLGRFIDTRGDGGYVVAPPSKHISGKAYEFWGQQPTEHLIEKLLDFPQQWLDKLNAPAHTSPPNGNGKANGASGVNSSNGGGIFVPPPDPGLIVPEEINTGKRNQTLIKLAGFMRRHGFAEDAIYSALKSENQRICKPPLDDAEVHSIARSSSRYAPKDALGAVDDDDNDDDFYNTIKAFSLGEFLNTKFDEPEIVGFHISRTEIGIIQAPTNAGKTTILRNVALSMAAGRPFTPFFDGHRPVKVAYFDFESSAQRAHPDITKMFSTLTPIEQAVARDNMAYIPKGMRNGELFQFNTSEDWVQYLLTENGIEFVFVDNISAAYDLNDENSNAEINRKVIKPLLKMAYKGNCAFLFAHHYGKGKTEIDQAGVHAGRGASNLQGLSQTVINMFGNVSKGEPITFECAKRKTDGGQNYREVFELQDDRWFHPTAFVAPPKAKSCADTLNDYINDNVQYPDAVTPADLADVFDGVFGIDMINKTLGVLAKNGYISKPSYGEYSARKKKPVKKSTPAVKNFYDKDGD